MCPPVPMQGPTVPPAPLVLPNDDAGTPALTFANLFLLLLRSGGLQNTLHPVRRDVGYSQLPPPCELLRSTSDLRLNSNSIATCSYLVSCHCLKTDTLLSPTGERSLLPVPLHFTRTKTFCLAPSTIYKWISLSSNLLPFPPYNTFVLKRHTEITSGLICSAAHSQSTHYVSSLLSPAPNTVPGRKQVSSKHLKNSTNKI